MSEAESTAQVGRPADSADVGWIQDYQAWRRGRLKGVQDSASVWLGLLTTLLTLLGSVVLFKGGDLVISVTDNGWFQFFLILLVGLVFVAAILALIAGGSATWGGATRFGCVPGRRYGTFQAEMTVCLCSMPRALRVPGRGGPGAAISACCYCGHADSATP